MEKLRRRLAELVDLASLEMLASWDQLVMMPGEGAAGRGHVLGTLARITHERATAEDIGEWLAGLDGADLDEVDRDIVRLARRDWERASKVPSDLAAEPVRGPRRRTGAWRVARAEDDFSLFAPALGRNVELARAYAGCLRNGGGGGLYQPLLDDFDFGLRAEQLRTLFGSLSEQLSGLLEQSRDNSSVREPAVPAEAQRRAVTATLKRIGVDETSWRVDVSAHPFTAWMGPRDTRVTTRYDDGGIESLLSSLHEYGHALYERQVDPALQRTNLGSGTSMSIHESQSKLWENHVARHPAFASVLAADLGEAGFVVGSANCTRRWWPLNPP